MFVTHRKHIWACRPVTGLGLFTWKRHVSCILNEMSMNTSVLEQTCSSRGALSLSAWLFRGTELAMPFATLMNEQNQFTIPHTAAFVRCICVYASKTRSIECYQLWDRWSMVRLYRAQVSAFVGPLGLCRHWSGRQANCRRWYGTWRTMRTAIESSNEAKMDDFVRDLAMPWMKQSSLVPDYKDSIFQDETQTSAVIVTVHQQWYNPWGVVNILWFFEVTSKGCSSEWKHLRHILVDHKVHKELAYENMETLSCLQCSKYFWMTLDEVNDFLNNLPNPYGRTRPGVYTASNRNEYQRHRNNVSGE
jgi:hypothetical protein